MHTGNSTILNEIAFCYMSLTMLKCRTEANIRNRLTARAYRTMHIHCVVHTNRADEQAETIHMLEAKMTELGAGHAALQNER